jgi:ubiquinone/menaquinone biosynthesis C-methylase UbiE
MDAAIEQMRNDWNARAAENARHYVATCKDDWDESEFLESGRIAVQQEILTDMTNICQGRDPKEMKVLEIGCGAGRITNALADVFGEVYAVDISDEMIKQARLTLADKPNAHVYLNNGKDLSVLPPIMFDFAYSYIVFQHIPSLLVIESYVQEVQRVLRPGALFKFQVQSGCDASDEPDTWTGFSFTEEESLELALRCNFEPRYSAGAGGQYFWLWFFKQPPELVRYVVAMKKYVLSLQRTCAAVQILPQMKASDDECFHLRLEEQGMAAVEYKSATEEFQAFLKQQFQK